MIDNVNNFKMEEDKSWTTVKLGITYINRRSLKFKTVFTKIGR